MIKYNKNQILDLIHNKAKEYGIDPAVLVAKAQIETGLNPKLRNKSGASGLFQFMPRTWKEFGKGNVFDPAANTDAAARFTLKNIQHFRKSFGRDPTPGETYLMHQQGAGGASSLLRNRDLPAHEVVGLKRIQQNLPKSMRGRAQNMTAGEFADFWIKNHEKRMGIVRPPRDIPNPPSKPVNSPDPWNNVPVEQALPASALAMTMVPPIKNVKIKEKPKTEDAILDNILKKDGSMPGTPKTYGEKGTSYDDYVGSELSKQFEKGFIPEPGSKAYDHYITWSQKKTPQPKDMPNTYVPGKGKTPVDRISESHDTATGKAGTIENTDVVDLRTLMDQKPIRTGPASSSMGKTVAGAAGGVGVAAAASNNEGLQPAHKYVQDGAKWLYDQILGPSESGAASAKPTPTGKQQPINYRDVNAADDAASNSRLNSSEIPIGVDPTGSFNTFGLDPKHIDPDSVMTTLMPAIDAAMKNPQTAGAAMTTAQGVVGELAKNDAMRGVAARQAAAPQSMPMNMQQIASMNANRLGGDPTSSASMGMMDRAVAASPTDDILMSFFSGGGFGE